jgi:hypothetical protein
MLTFDEREIAPIQLDRFDTPGFEGPGVFCPTAL